MDILCFSWGKHPVERILQYSTFLTASTSNGTWKRSVHSDRTLACKILSQSLRGESKSREDPKRLLVRPSAGSASSTSMTSLWQQGINRMTSHPLSLWGNGLLWAVGMICEGSNKWRISRSAQAVLKPKRFRWDWCATWIQFGAAMRKIGRNQH